MTKKTSGVAAVSVHTIYHISIDDDDDCPVYDCNEYEGVMGSWGVWMGESVEYIYNKEAEGKLDAILRDFLSNSGEKVANG